MKQSNININELPEELTLEDCDKYSPLKRETLIKRFYSKNYKKWGIYEKPIKTTLKVVKKEDFIKYFLKKMSGNQVK